MKMGAIKFFSSSSFDAKQEYREPVKWKPDPSPKNFEVIRYTREGGYLIIEIRYFDCDNYEGRKVMVYDCSLIDLLSQNEIDPHFSDNKKYHSPIARFEPTEKGWNNAIILAKNI